MKTRAFTISLLYFILCALNCIRVFAQGDAKQLVITEANLDFKNQEVWVEIFNPTDVPLLLNSMRISGIKTPNILPKESNDQKEIEIKPVERIIFCSDINSFRNKYGNEIRVVELRPLKALFKGGFIAINHLTGVENSKNAVRFGPGEKSRIIAEKVRDDEVLNFSDDSMSYERKVLKGGSVSSWSKTIPTPGK